MSVEPNTLERSALERKDREELTTIALALGAKPPSRARKADIVQLILELTGVESGAAASGVPGKAEAPPAASATGKADDGGPQPEAPVGADGGADTGADSDSDSDSADPSPAARRPEPSQIPRLVRAEPRCPRLVRAGLIRAVCVPSTGRPALGVGARVRRHDRRGLTRGAQAGIPGPIVTRRSGRPGSATAGPQRQGRRRCARGQANGNRQPEPKPGRSEARGARAPGATATGPVQAGAPAGRGHPRPARGPEPNQARTPTRANPPTRARTPTRTRGRTPTRARGRRRARVTAMAARPATGGDVAVAAAARTTRPRSKSSPASLSRSRACSTCGTRATGSCGSRATWPPRTTSTCRSSRPVSSVCARATR